MSSPSTRERLFEAADEGDEATIFEILDSGFDPHTQDSMRSGLLHKAVRGCSKSTIERLIQMGLDVHAFNGNKENPLGVAAKFNNLDTCIALMDAGARCDAHFKDECCPLEYAVAYGSVDLCAEMLSRDPKLASLQLEDGSFILHQVQSAEHARLFIQHGADVHALDSQGNTPLHLASINREPGLRYELVAHGADVNAKNLVGRTPLHNAAQWGRHDICLDLIRLGADVNAKDRQSQSPADACSNTRKPDRNARAWLTLVAFGATINNHDLSHPFHPVTAHQAAAKAGLTQRALHLIENAPSRLPEDQPAPLAELALDHNHGDTAAAIQSFLARMEIERAMSQKLAAAP